MILQRVISNLQSKIQVELSKFDTKNEVTSIQLDLLPEVTIPAFLTNELTCAFYDPELILKQLDTQIQKIEVEIAKSQRMPALSLSLGISSNDYHSGPHGNNYSAKLSITGPLYDGGTIKTEISDAEDFANLMEELSAGQIVPMEVVRYSSGETETLMVNLTDKYEYYLDLGYEEDVLESMDIEQGDAFLGVQNLAGGTAGVDRLAGWAHPDFETSGLGYIISVPINTLQILITPFEYQGVAIHPAQEEMLDSGDGWLASTIGLSGLLFLINLLFWLIWVNILLGLTNLFPMIPFDGGHLFKDMVHGIMSGVRKLGKKTGLYKLHPLWVEHFTRKASTISSLMLFAVLILLIGAPYL